MFRIHLETAKRHGRYLQQQIDEAVASPFAEDVMAAAARALEAAWKMESSLGELLSVDDYQARATGYWQARESARKGFLALRDRLGEADEAVRRIEPQIKDYLGGLRDRVDNALSFVDEGTHAITEPARLPQVDLPPSTVSVASDRELAKSQRGIKQLVARALEPLGGMASFVHPGQTVLIKPNLTLFFLPSEGVTTDGRVVAALASLAYEAGASRVIVGESAGGGSRTLENMAITGMTRLARQAAASTVDFHTCEQTEVEIPNGRKLKRFTLPAPLVEADVIINSPKAKTHHQDLISCALKNWVGTPRADIRSAHHDWDTYQEYVDIMLKVPPTLNVVDAIFIGEGNGPGANSGRFYGGIIASADPVATDVVVAQLLGLDPRLVTFVHVAAESGLGVADPDRIKIAGQPLDQVRLQARPPRLGVDYYPANVIVGMGVSRPGTVGHFKSSADIWLKIGAWEAISRLKGRPTILIGDADDPLFTTHLREGPYVVIDDASPEKYKHDVRVHFIPGHPCLHNMLPLLLEGLGIPTLGKAAMELMKVTRRARSRLAYLRS